ncbi:hypothetical protein IMY05_001G0203400 [Salix suchowensis]|nr:hypothetical protein IMY05_001G0203400 [Salix suchowensis]
MKTIVGGNHCKYTLARNPEGTELFKTKNHRCAVSVEGNPGQEQALTFFSNGIPFVTLNFSFHKLRVFFAVPYRFVTVAELEPPA